MADIIIEVPTVETQVIQLNTGEITWPAETSYTVEGGTSGTQPTFTGAPMFDGSYILQGELVHFRVNVDFDNITSFGTGQYYVTLPFESKYGLMMRDGCLHRASNGNQYAISGHVLAGSDVLQLFYTGGNGHDEAFDYNSPYTLTINDSFHIAGVFIRTAD